MIFGSSFKWGESMEIIKMSSKELLRGAIIADAAEGKCTQKRASQELGLSLRQIKRLCKKYRTKGLGGLAHGNRGKSSNRRIPDTTRKRISGIIEEKYTDFGPQLVKEQLEERHQIKRSREWLRQLMIKEGLWKVNKRKDKKAYQRRNRRSQEGELLQIDGSYHDWFEGRAEKCCLINMVDDATGKIKELRFVEHENTKDYFEAMNRYIKKNGIPLAVYSDRHSIFKGEKQDSQFARAMKELGIAPILARTPQAKGRVERSHGTLQDRLIKLMRLEKINTIEEGNKYIEKFRKDYNKRFGRKAKNPEDAHKKLKGQVKLERILCIKEERTISKRFTVQYENKTYQLKDNSYRLIGKKICIYEMGTKMILEYEGKEYEYTVYEEQPYEKCEMDRKRLESYLDKKKPLTIIERQRKRMAVNF